MDTETTTPVTETGKNEKNGASLATIPPVEGFKKLRAYLVKSFVERDTTIDAILVALAAGEHVFLYGKPGLAKSAILNAIGKSLQLRYWEYLLTRFSVPEEVFGSLKITALQRDVYERSLAGRMADAELVFLDEIWKANSAILNALLTILNERKFSNGAGAPVQCPLLSCFSAANELPEGPELNALYDRFMVRVHVEPIADRDNFLTFMRARHKGQPSVPIVPIDMPRVHREVRAVGISEPTFQAFADMREAISRAGIDVSDRRWGNSEGIVQARAWLDGRNETQPDDLEALESCLWRDPAERDNVVRLVQGLINPNAAKAVAILDAAKASLAALPPLPKGQMTEPELNALLAKYAGANRDMTETIAKLKSLGSGRKIDAARAEVGRIRTQIREMSQKAMGGDASEEDVA